MRPWMSELSAKQLAALRLLEKGEEYQKYFFRKVSGLVWFDALKEKGYFSAHYNPRPIVTEEGFYSIPQWPVLDYLEKVSLECSVPENKRYAEELLKIIRDVTAPIEGKPADNYRTWWYFTKILANLPPEIIGLGDVDLISIWLESEYDTTLVGRELGQTLVPTFLGSSSEADWNKAVKIIEIATNMDLEKSDYGESLTRSQPKTAIDAYSLQELLQANADIIGEECGELVIEILVRRLQQIGEVDSNNEYSYMWRPAIEDNQKNMREDSIENVLVSSFRDITLAFSKKGDEASGVLKDLLGGDLYIGKRVALYVIGELFEFHQTLFWGEFSRELFDSNYRHELFGLLKEHFSEFSSEQQELVINTIDELSQEWREDDDKARAEASQKLIWFQAIRGQGNKRADSLYDKNRRIAGHEPTHPEFTSVMEISSGIESPISTQKILDMEIDAIVKYLGEFVERGRWEDPTEEGLADALRDAIKENPKKFEEQLDKFLSVKFIYQYSIVRAFRECWAEGKMIDWGILLHYCLSIVKNTESWLESASPDASELPQPTFAWVISEVSDLIIAGVKDDEWAFEEALMPTAEEIIILILEEQESTAQWGEEDALAEAIDTEKGRCIEALFYYSLRHARLDEKKYENHQEFWISIQAVFDRELDQCKDANLEFSSLAGLYLPHLIFLNESWTKTNLNRIFSNEYYKNWYCAIEGYAYVSRFYANIYELLRNNSHLRRALETQFRNVHTRENLIKQISVAYLKELENLTYGESLFRQIVTEWKQDDISGIVRFFWMHRDSEIEERIREQILEFWGWCYERINGDEEENRIILSDLNLLSGLLREVSDREKDWLMQSAPYVIDNHNSFFFMEYLDRLCDKSPSAVAEVFIKMLARATPTFEEERVLSIVKKLYEAGLGIEADKICHMYAERQYDFLTPLYRQQH
jgi:hypothetical protein